MSQSIGNAEKDQKSEKCRPKEDNTTAHGKHGTKLVPLSGEGEPLHEIRAQRLLVVSLCVTLDINTVKHSPKIRLNDARSPGF